MHLRTEVPDVLSSVSNTLQDDSFLENLDYSVKVKLLSKNAAAISAIYKKIYHETTPASLAK